MEELLRTEFTKYYQLTKPTATDIAQTTSAPYFEVEDEKRELIIYTDKGKGTAKFENPERDEITIINHDKFVSSTNLEGGRCDCIVYATNRTCFLLGELKDRVIDENKLRKGVRRKAKKQLISSLRRLISVPAIHTFIDAFQVKRCCYFNKKAEAPSSIRATTAFNRMNTLLKEGKQISSAEFEIVGFELWEYTGEQTFTFTTNTIPDKE
jgi:hypothetical protein